MRWLTTILLSALVAGGVAYLLFGGRRGETAQPATLVALKDQLKPENVKRIERTLPGSESLVLTRSGDEWAFPGNWPVRQVEAGELAAALAELKTRFQAIPLPGDPDLKPYGLDPSQKPVVVRVDAAARTLTLTFGQSPDAKDTSFGRTTYLRLDDNPEVLRLGPDAYAAVTKPVDTYRRKQLFPDFARVKLSGGEPPPNPMNPTPPATAGRTAIPTDKLTALRVESPTGGFAIKRIAPTPPADAEKGSGEPSVNVAKVAGAWELTDAGMPTLKALRDRVDPAKLRSVLTALPEIWAEDFAVNKSEAETGLDTPARSVQLHFANGNTTTLRIGKLSRRVEKDGVAPPPAQPFAPPPPPAPKKVEEFYYAKLDNNPLVFEIRGDKFPDLFAMPDDLRDASLARLESGDVTEVAIAAKGQPPLTLTKKKGNKDADKEDDKQDRWTVGDRLAESGKVTELLDALAKLEAKTREERIDDADPKKLGELGFDSAATKVKVTAVDKAGAKATTEYVLGKHDVEKKKLNVQIAGWPRVSVVADDVLKLVERPVLAYRGRRLFDSPDAKLVALTVTPNSGGAFALKTDSDKKWQITQPVVIAADDSKASQLTGDLTRLEVTEYVDDAPKPEDLDKKYGVAKPALTVRLGFDGNKEQTLEIGSAVEFKPEVYARLAGTSQIFTLPKATVESLTAGAVGLMPLQQWSVPADKVVAIEITRPDGEKYKLEVAGGNWKLSGAFDAPVPFLNAQPVVTAVSAVRAEKFETLTTADLAKYGLDKPVRVATTYREMVGDKEENVTKTILLGASPVDNAAMKYAKLDGGAGVFVLPDTLAKEADKPALDRLDRTLYVIDAANIAKVQITAPTPEASTTLVWEKPADKGNVKVEGKPYAVDQLGANSLLFAVTRPLAVRLAAYGSNLNFSEYGLDKPEFTITTTLTDSKTHVIKLGKVVPAGGAVLEAGGRFARVDEGPAVAVLSAAHAAALTRGPLEIVDRTLLSFDPAQVASLVRKEGSEVLEIVPGTVSGWEIVQPAKQKADPATLDELAEQLSRLRAATVVAYDPKDLEEYGLRQPLYTVTLKIGLEKPTDKVLKLGLEVDEGKTGDRYATVDGKTVGVLPGALVAKLIAAPLKFRDRTLARFVDADRATLTRGDRTITFAKVSGTWKVVKPVAAEAEQTDLEEMINAVAKLRADELVEQSPATLAPFGLDKPEATWTLALGDKDVLKLSLGKRDKTGQRVYAKVEGGDTVALLDAALTSRLFSEYRKRAVWNGVDAAQAETVAISGTTNFALRKQGAVWVESNGDALTAATVTELLDTLAGLKAERYVIDENADVKLYGLEPPQRVITLMLKGGVVKTLHLGRAVGGEGGRVYARVAEKDRSEVFVLSEADSAKLLKDRGAYLARKSP